MGKIRLDEWLVENGHYVSRARARDAILRGCVTMAGSASIKPSRNVLDPDSIKIDDPAARLVSRAAIKLEFGLKETGYSPKDKVALDVGASTGGFCQILLDEGATRVFGVDVGHEQMDERLLENPRTQGIFLIKPQFEVGKDGLGKGGVVRDESLAVQTAHSIRDWMDNFPGWNVTHFMPSPLKGGDGNKEFLMAATKND